MDVPYDSPQTPVATRSIGASTSAVSWGAVSAGTAVAISVSLLLLTLGAGLGLASLGPSIRSTASPGHLAALATVWVIIVQWLSATAGGYVTGRLRTRWVGTHTHEVFFRDTAHGLVTWAVATAIVAIAVASAASPLLAGGIRAAASGTAQGTAGTTSTQGAAVAAYDVDALFRTAPTEANSSATVAASDESRTEATRILANGLSGGGVQEADRAYLAQLVVERTGVPRAEAQERVDDIVARTQQKVESARKAAAMSSLLTALAMLVGAFVACVAAALGGRERDQHP